MSNRKMTKEQEKNYRNVFLLLFFILCCCAEIANYYHVVWLQYILVFVGICIGLLALFAIVAALPNKYFND